MDRGDWLIVLAMAVVVVVLPVTARLLLAV